MYDDGDNIDFLYNLQPHGWSTCLLSVNDDIYTFAITHIFSCPIADMIEAIMLINKGAVESEFVFPGEPGGCRWWLRRNDKQHHKVIITISEISDFFTKAEKEQEEVLVTFEIKKKQLSTLIYFQLSKIAALLEDKSYRDKRVGEFPFVG
ncbi:hypothetical protein NIES4071_72780 [Calothrix sp. NIES-4071]|nr:hypothetical protein NIES4071_72780 [Calothrix sp. NIES-4071]BAZ61553.1 hypothetical protein NIES4105_72730 [Calothrix sp. NIES-4105]